MSTTYYWYNIYNKDTFVEDGIPSRELDLELEAIGQKTILLTVGNKISVVIDDVILSLELNDKNPFEFEDHAVYIDEDNEIWLGFAS